MVFLPLAKYFYDLQALLRAGLFDTWTKTPAWRATGLGTEVWLFILVESALQLARRAF